MKQLADRLKEEERRLASEWESATKVLEEERSIAMHAVEVEASKLAAERDAFSAEVMKWEEIDTEVRKKSNPDNSGNDILELNVGGEILITTRSTLTMRPDSMLAAMFSGRHSLVTDNQGRVFVDRNPSYFKLIIDFLRKGALQEHLPVLPPGHDRDGFLSELEYFCLPTFPADFAKLPLTLSVGGCSGNFSFKWGSEGVNDGQFNYPVAVAVDNSFVYVADEGSHHIQVFRKNDGSFCWKWGINGKLDGQFDCPVAVAVDNTCVYVADQLNHRIQVFRKNDGVFLRKWGSYGNAHGQFIYPVGVAIDEDQVYVADRDNRRIQVFRKSSGNFIRKWGSDGKGDAQFAYPSAVAVDDQHVFVADEGNHRIQVFLKIDGTYVRKWGLHGRGDGQFDCPYGIAVDDECVYVTDCGNRRIQVFRKSDGCFVRTWGSEGKENGQFDCPYGVAVDDGRAYVADQRNQRIQVFL